MIVFILTNAFPGFDKIRPEKLDKNLQSIVSFRNLIAHRKLDVRPEILLNYDGKTINLIAYTTDQNRIKPSVKAITQELINTESKLIADTAQLIMNIGELIRQKP